MRVKVIRFYLICLIFGKQNNKQMGLNNWGFGKEGWSGVGTNPCQHYGRTRCRLLARARLHSLRDVSLEDSGAPPGWAHKSLYVFMVTFLKHLGSPLLKILKFGIRVGFVETRIVFKCERLVSNPGGARGAQSWALFIHFFM